MVSEKLIESLRCLRKLVEIDDKAGTLQVIDQIVRKIETDVVDDLEFACSMSCTPQFNMRDVRMAEPLTRYTYEEVFTESTWNINRNHLTTFELQYWERVYSDLNSSWNKKFGKHVQNKQTFLVVLPNGARMFVMFYDGSLLISTRARRGDQIILAAESGTKSW